MAEAFKCDRCGKFYTKYGDNVSYKVAQVVENSAEAGWHRRYKELDLCLDCSASLAEWCKAGKSVKEE